ncbi:MAG: DUF4838 domain-containing protein [Candidatus Sulfotelmatobacter sp.]
MQTLKCLILFLAISVAFGRPVEPAPHVTLTAGGNSEYVIVVAPERQITERFAAEELQKYIRLISGVTLPVVDHSAGHKQILIGAAAGHIDSFLNRNADSYLIRIHSGEISLAGASLRGTLYSVYRFLEEYLGCGWIMPGDDYVPHQPNLEVPEHVDEMQSPAFEYRAICLFPYADTQIHDRLRVDSLFPYALLQVTKDRIDWAAKNRLNFVHPAVNEAGPKLWEEVRSREQIVPEIVKRGLGLHYGGHSYFAWLPPEKYFAAHPDYYAAIQDGKPQSLNVANPEVADVMAQNIGDFLEKNPEISIVTVWMNDAPAICTTPGCLAMEGPLRLSISNHADDYPPMISFSNAALKFTNAVARRLHKTHPQVIVNHLAYNELIDAPTDVVPEPNVLVAFAPIQRAPFRIGSPAGYFRPLNDPDNPVNRGYLSEMRKWLALSKNFYVWDYYSLWWTLGHDRPRWEFPVLDTMNADLRFYRDELGLTHVSSEIADWQEENMYAYARLAWNPNASWRDVLADFCRRSYGPAAEDMLQHWTVLESAKENWFQHREECSRYLARALTKADTAEFRRRIDRAAGLWQESRCQHEGSPLGSCKQ